MGATFSSWLCHRVDRLFRPVVLLCVLAQLALSVEPGKALDLREIGADLAITPAQIERMKSWEDGRIYGARAAREYPVPFGPPEYMRIGNFFVMNRIDTSFTYNSNVFAAPGKGRGDLNWQTTPLLVIRSDLPRHIFDLQISGNFSRQMRETSLNHDDAATRLSSIFHLDHAHIASLTAGFERTHEDRLSVGAALNATSLTPSTHSFASASLKRDAGRMWASTGVSFDSWQYENVSTANGTIIDQSHRDLMVTATDLKIGYRFSPGFELVNRFRGLRQQNTGDQNLDTTAWGAEAISGIRLEWGPLLKIALEGGYGIRDYDRPGVETAGIGLIKGRVDWLITHAMTASLQYSRSFDDGVGSSTAPGDTGGRVQQLATAQLEFWALRNLMFTLGADYLETTFQDGGPVDQRYVARGSLLRHVNKNTQVTFGLEYLDQHSTNPLYSIERALVTTGVRIQF